MTGSLHFFKWWEHVTQAPNGFNQYNSMNNNRMNPNMGMNPNNMMGQPMNGMMPPQQQNNNNKNNNNVVIIVVIAVLSLIAMVCLGIFVYTKVFSNKDNKNSRNNQTQNVYDDNNNNNNNNNGGNNTPTPVNDTIKFGNAIFTKLNGNTYQINSENDSLSVSDNNNLAVYFVINISYSEYLTNKTAFVANVESGLGVQCSYPINTQINGTDIVYSDCNKDSKKLKYFVLKTTNSNYLYEGVVRNGTFTNDKSLLEYVIKIANNSKIDSTSSFSANTENNNNFSNISNYLDI